MKFNYPLKHWLTTILLGPLFPIVFSLIFGEQYGQEENQIAFYPLFLLFSIAFSMPTIFMYYLIYYYLKTTDIKPTHLKLTVIIWTILGISMTFLFMGGKSTIYYIIIYSIAAIISGLIWKIDVEENEIPEN